MVSHGNVWTIAFCSCRRTRRNGHVCHVVRLDQGRVLYRERLAAATGKDGPSIGREDNARYFQGDHTMTTPAIAHELRALGIIPDGSRRWAGKNGGTLLDAYCRSAQVFTELLEGVLNARPTLEHIAVYVLSKSNLRRNQSTIAAVLGAATRLCAEMLPGLCTKHGLAVRFVGKGMGGTRLANSLPAQQFQRAVRSLENLTLSGRRATLHLVAGYDAMEEINDIRGPAAQRPVTMDRLAVPTQLDLVLRTAGERRLSGFLPLQASYAELWTIPQLFPDVRLTDLLDVVTAYERGERTNGR